MSFPFFFVFRLVFAVRVNTIFNRIIVAGLIQLCLFIFQFSVLRLGNFNNSNSYEPAEFYYL